MAEVDLDKQAENKRRQLANLSKPGMTNNPNGRPKGKTLFSRIKEIISDDAEGDRLARAWVEQAANGSFNHLREIVDREDGPVANRLANADGGNLAIAIVPTLPEDWFTRQMGPAPTPELTNGQPTDSGPADVAGVVDAGGPVDPQGQ